MTDPLTKLRNRRYFSLVVDEDARRAQRAYHLLPGVERQTTGISSST